MSLKKSIAAAVLLLVWGACQKTDPQIKENPLQKESPRTVSEKLPPAKKLSYHPFIVSNKDSAFSALEKRHTPEEIFTILALNRLDYKNKWRADTLVVPSFFDADFRVYSPFPREVKRAEALPKLVLFSYSMHAFGVYEQGKLVRWGPTSMGRKESPTKTGLGFANWKKKLAISTSNSDWKLRWNVNVFNYAGIGWHQYDLPGYHASHSCMRLLEEDARWMYHWVDTWILDRNGHEQLAKGTPVILFGSPNFAVRPWLQLLASPEANSFTEQDIAAEIEPYVEEMLKQQKLRQQVMLKMTDPVAL